MKLQREPYDCGVYAILNGARALGVKLTPQQIRKHTDTDTTGTTQHGIMNALEKLGFEHDEFLLPKEPAFNQLFQGPIILAVEDSRHWIVTIGTLGRRVITFDSWMAKWNAQENGVNVLSKQQLMRWWTAADKEGQRYGIRMWRKRKRK